MIKDIRIVVCGRTSCYVIKAKDGYILIDTGISNRQEDLIEQLYSLGCTPGSIKLILLTHGHYDHVGNTVYLKKIHGAKVAMHKGDIDTVRNASNEFPEGNSLLGSLMRNMSIRKHKEIKWEAFEPDILLDDNSSLTEYGFDAKVIHLPGHTKGSIGFLTGDKKLFSGDTVMNIVMPGLALFAEDFSMLRQSVDYIKNLDIDMIYPGHGKPFEASRIYLI